MRKLILRTSLLARTIHTTTTAAFQSGRLPKLSQRPRPEEKVMAVVPRRLTGNKSKQKARRSHWWKPTALSVKKCLRSLEALIQKIHGYHLEGRGLRSQMAGSTHLLADLGAWPSHSPIVRLWCLIGALLLAAILRRLPRGRAPWHSCSSGWTYVVGLHLLRISIGEVPKCLTITSVAIK